MPATNLTAHQLGELRITADIEAGPFVDPRIMRAVESWWRRGVHADWAQAVLGADRPVTSLLWVKWRDWYLLHLAHQAEPEPPVSEPVAAMIAETNAAIAARVEHQRRVDAWQRVAAAVAPARLVFAHNYRSRRHTETYVQGADHAVLFDGYRNGRLVRAADEALCETPSNAKHLEFSHARTGLDNTPYPTCRACARIAARILGVEIGELL